MTTNEVGTTRFRLQWEVNSQSTQDKFLVSLYKNRPQSNTFSSFATCFIISLLRTLININNTNYNLNIYTFQVKYALADGGGNFADIEIDALSAYSRVINQLSPGKTYHVNLTAISNTVQGETETLTQTTRKFFLHRFFSVALLLSVWLCNYSFSEVSE